MSDMPYRTFIPANVAGGIVWGIAFSLLGYFVGNAYRKIESVSGIASDVLLGLLAVLIVVLVIRGRRKERAQLAEAASAASADAPPGPDEPG
jgi:membrane protein DedA with SNARE-associated domain